MKENFGNGWIDRGPRAAVPGWDDNMRSVKKQEKFYATALEDDYSEESMP